MKRLLFLVLFSSVLFAETEWRAYDLFMPDAKKYAVTPTSNENNQFNDSSSIVWFKGGWYCFWNTKANQFEKNQICYSISRDLMRWSKPKTLFESDILGTKAQAFVFGKELWLLRKNVSGKLILSIFEDMRGECKDFTVDIESIDANSDITVIGNPFIVETGVVGMAVLVIDDESRKMLTIHTKNNGQTWYIVGQVSPIPIGEFESCCWQSGTSSISMILKPQYDKDDPSCYYSISDDFGVHWSYPQKYPADYVYTPITAFNSSNWLDAEPRASRNYIVTNDSQYIEGEGEIWHDNLALHTKIGQDFSFTAAITLSKTDPIAVNPSCFVKDNRLITSYTSGKIEQLIKLAILELPANGQHYIYPRSTGFADTDCPEKRGTYYHFASEQYCSSVAPVKLDESGMTICGWIRTDLGGQIFSSKTENNTGGFSWGIEDSKQVIELPGTGKITSPVIRGLNGWKFLAAEVDALKGEVRFYSDTELISNIEYDKEKLKYLSGDKGIIGNGQRQGFAGDIRAISIYSTAIKPEVIKSCYASECWELKKMAYSEKFTEKPELLVLRFDPDKDSSMKNFEFPKEQKGGVVEFNSQAGKKFLYFNGEASASLDIDYNSRKYGDYLQVEFSFKMLSNAETVICTFGDRDVPVRVVARNNAVYMRFRDNEQVLGELKPNSWNTIDIFTGGSISRTKMNNYGYRQISHTPISNWVYLGQGFHTGKEPRDGRFAIDVGSVRTRVLNKEL